MSAAEVVDVVAVVEGLARRARAAALASARLDAQARRRALEAMAAAIDAHRAQREFQAIVPVSALSGDGCDQLIAAILPNRSMRFISCCLSRSQERPMRCPWRGCAKSFGCAP